MFLWYRFSPILTYLRTSADNERGAQHTQHFLSDLMTANKRRLPASLLYTSAARETVLAIDVAAALLTPATSSLSAHYPGIRISGSSDDQAEQGSDAVAYLRVVPDCRSLRVATEFEDLLQRTHTDPVSGILTAVEDRRDGLHASIRFSLEPCSPRRRRRARRVAARAAGVLGKWLPSLIDAVAMLANGSLLERIVGLPLALFAAGEVPADTLRKTDDHLFRVTIELRVSGPPAKRHLAEKRLLSLAGAFAPFASPGTVDFLIAKRPVRSLLSAAELAALWHPPVALARTESMKSTPLPHLPAPIGMKDASKEEGSLPIGITAIGTEQRFGVAPEDRLHQLVIGKTGMGKSTLLNVQIDADIAEGRGVGLIDPHGDLVADVMRTIPTNRTNDVIVIDPTSETCPTVNTLACHDVTRRQLVVENNLAAISKVFKIDVDNAPRLFHILRFTLMALVGTKYASYLYIEPMLVDKQFRKKVVDQVEDPVVRSFWVDQVGKWTERYEQEAMPAILNKTGTFIADPRVRHLFGDPKGGLDLRHAMDSGKIILVNLSQGTLGQGSATFVGSMLMAAFQNAVMSRADIEREDRRPFYLYADEYATFVNESFADTLAQARKYQLYLTAAQQNITQIENKDKIVMDAMFSNLWTLITFQVAQEDAERLAAELAGHAKPEDLLTLPKYHAIVRTAIDGIPTRPFVVKTLPPPKITRRHAKIATIMRVLERRHRRHHTAARTV